jgi:hypothetical protein
MNSGSIDTMDAGSIDTVDACIAVNTGKHLQTLAVSGVPKAYNC